MGFGDPDHHHPLTRSIPEMDANCFRCELPFMAKDICYGCTRCNHFVHQLCLGLPGKMRYPLHPGHSLILLPSPNSQITDNCNKCHESLLGGYIYSCQECLEYNLHLKCFLTLKLETKHCHPLRLCENYYGKDCRICGLLFDHSDKYIFACDECQILIHFDCGFIPPTVQHHHVHELTLEYNFPERSDMVYCDRCEDRDGTELDRTLSYYYCERCDYIAHVRCVTTQPAIVTIQFHHFIHEHPMIHLRNPSGKVLSCAACTHYKIFESFYFCSICNYALHKSCAEFPRFIKHPHHKEDHTLSLHSSASQSNDCELVCCEFCTKELEGKGWILQCSDCDYAVHMSCACKFEHPLYKDKILSFSYKGTDFRCNACGELGDGSRMSRSQNYLLLQPSLFGLPRLDFHIECFGLPGQIKHSCHSHLLYLVSSPTEIESSSSVVFQCDICHAEADPDLWVYCCMQCKYIAHLKCVVSDLLPTPGRSHDLSNLCSISLCGKEKFRVRTKMDHCSKLVELVMSRPSDDPVFLLRGFFDESMLPIGHCNGQPITSDVTDLDKSFTGILHCPKCGQPISAQAHSNVYDWIHRNLKPGIYQIQIETPVDYESLALLDEKVVDELYCPICNLVIFSPTYSCAECQIFFHKSCAELPRKYTVDGGHTFILQSPSMNNGNLTKCSKCEHPFKGFAYFCASCDIGFDVTCALGAPLLKIENQKHSLYISTSVGMFGVSRCGACGGRVDEEDMSFRCGVASCLFFLHIECAMLPPMVKHRIHQHPLVLEPRLDLSVDDYICDACEKELNPCIWVYRCSDICGDRATSHVSCIVTSKKKKIHFVYNEECSYPHLDDSFEDDLLIEKMEVPSLVAALVDAPPQEQYRLLSQNLSLFVDELEHEYADQVTSELMKMDQVGVLHLMESPDALREKVADTIKHLTHVQPEANNEDVEEENDDNEVALMMRKRKI